MMLDPTALSGKWFMAGSLGELIYSSEVLTQKVSTASLENKYNGCVDTRRAC
jgi:hypothetical protein